MLKRVLLVLPLFGMLSGCLLRERRVDERRPVEARTTVVRSCPAGYSFDGNDCHPDRRPERDVVIEVRPR